MQCQKYEERVKNKKKEKESLAGKISICHEHRVCPQIGFHLWPKICRCRTSCWPGLAGEEDTRRCLDTNTTPSRPSWHTFLASKAMASSPSTSSCSSKISMLTSNFFASFILSSVCLYLLAALSLCLPCSPPVYLSFSLSFCTSVCLSLSLSFSPFLNMSHIRIFLTIIVRLFENACVH